MATSVFLTLGWCDDRLKYNPSEYGGVNVSRIPADDLWVPDLILQNRYVLAHDSQFLLSEYLHGCQGSRGSVTKYTGFACWHYTYSCGNVLANFQIYVNKLLCRAT